MGARLKTFALATGLFTAGCGFFMEPKPDLENLKTAEVAGLSVKHPGNWKTELESEDIDGVKFSSLTIESKGNAIAVVQVFEPGVPLSEEMVFDTYVEGMVEASQTEFGGVVDVALRSSEDFSFEVMKSDWQGRKGVIDLKLLGEAVPHRIQTVQKHSDEKTIIIVAQAPVEDWKTAEPGFVAIYDGLTDSE